jgi:hypothetical protein
MWERGLKQTMAKQEHKKFKEPQDALDVLSRNGVVVSVKEITAHWPGLKVMSAIDFLCHYCYYQVFYSL